MNNSIKDKSFTEKSWLKSKKLRFFNKKFLAAVNNTLNYIFKFKRISLDNFWAEQCTIKKEEQERNNLAEGPCSRTERFQKSRNVPSPTPDIINDALRKLKNENNSGPDNISIYL